MLSPTAADESEALLQAVVRELKAVQRSVA